MMDHVTVLQQPLAILGGPQAFPWPTPPWPFYAEDEVAAVTAVLHSGKVNYWTGEIGRLFEQEFALHCEVAHAVAVANGSVALEIALRALAIGPGDEVIVTPRSFIASASSIILVGAIPVFVDIDHSSQNITPLAIKAALTPRTRAIIAVHLAGWPCDMDAIVALAKDAGIYLIEDCAQAHGAVYRGRPVGSFGDLATFSFCQDKILSTGGEGGMITTNSRDLWSACWSFKDHGKSYDTYYHKTHPSGFRWLHESFGSNGRLTEMQSAIGRIQLTKLAGWVRQRRRNAAILHSCLADISILSLPEPPVDIGHSFYKYYVQVIPERIRDPVWSRDRIMAAINAEGVSCIVGSCSEIYQERAFLASRIGPDRRLPVAARMGETALMFLVHPTIDEERMLAMGQAIRKVLLVVEGNN